MLKNTILYIKKKHTADANILERKCADNRYKADIIFKFFLLMFKKC